MDFFESIKHIEFFNIPKKRSRELTFLHNKERCESHLNELYELKNEDIKEKIDIKLLLNGNIKIKIDGLPVNEFLYKFYKECNEGIYYKQKIYPIFELPFRVFDNEKELRKIMKKYIYKKNYYFCDIRWFKKKFNE